MKGHRSFLLAIFAAIAFSSVAEPATKTAPDQLSVTVAALDSALFDAFNRCSEPDQLAKHASYFVDDVEFYHDNGGVTWNRDDMLANTKKYVCGNFRRELMPDTLKVFPIKGFGAISQGTHRFCQFNTGECDGLAEFTMIWREQAGIWQITRVLSYGHRASASGH
ncbi:nuclear transport factor 2 family protein [Chromatiaceae bacterium AAb-1]|nr:nuclear transport factor 2 family protein [Chromatiaceae bacterium AAb-1]